MADNPTIAEIKAAEIQAANAVQKAKEDAVKKFNRASADAENSLKEARQNAARNFRDRIRKAEEQAEMKAKEVLSKREAEAKAFYDTNKNKIQAAASFITEEVMKKYGSS